MVRKKGKNGKTYAVCEECGFGYADESWADRCEAWCREHKTCNLEIIKHSVGPVL